MNKLLGKFGEMGREEKKLLDTFWKWLFALIFPHFSKMSNILGNFELFFQFLLFFNFKNKTHFKNYRPRHRPEKPAKKGQELTIPEISVGERTRIFGLNIDPWKNVRIFYQFNKEL